MPETTTTFDGLLKRVYGKRIVQQQNKAAFLYKMLPKSIYKPKGEGFYPSVSVTGNQQGGGAINESEALRTSGNETRLQFTISPKIMTWVMSISGLARAVSEGNEASYATGIVRMFDEALENTIKDINRQAYGNGQGTLAVVSGTQTSTTITFDDVIYLKPGMVVDTYDSTGTTRGNNSVTISSIDRVNNQATFSASLTVTDNDILVREETLVSADSDGKEMAGTTLIIDDGTESTTFQNQSRTTYPILRGNVITAGNVNLTNDLLQRSVDEVSIVGDGNVDFLISRHGQRRRYLDLVIPDKRFTGGKLDRGYQTMEWNGKSWSLNNCHLN